MANTTWNNLTLCSINDIQDALGSLNVPMNFSSNADRQQELEQIITQVYSRAKRFIYNDIALYAKKRLPETIDNWLNYRRYQTNNMSQSLQRDLVQMSEIAGVQMAEYIQTGSFTDLYWMLFLSGLALHPATFSIYGTPGTGTSAFAAGTANIGDICIDTQHWFLYINISTDQNSPTWTKLIASSVMDNLLNVGYDVTGNPGFMQQAAVNKTISLMFEKGATTDRIGFDQMGYFRDMKDSYEKEYQKHLAIALPQVGFDFDEDGVISDYERSFNSNNDWCLL